MKELPLQNSAILLEGGYFGTEKMSRLQELLIDFDPDLELQWIPTDKRVAEDKYAYRLVHKVRGEQPYVVMMIKESDDPQEIFARLLEGDNKNGNVQRRLEAQQLAHRAFQMAVWREQLEESSDKFHFLFTNRSKNYVKWKDDKTGEIIKLDSLRRRVK